MELTEKFLTELQRRLKVGNRRGVHLNAIPANSRYKFDLNRLAHIDKKLPDNFVKALLSELPLKFKISWKDNIPDLNSLFVEDQVQLVKITKAFENLINQTEAIESEKGINTFGFGFPILTRRDRSDNKLTVAPILIWSLRIRRTKEFNTWEILRNEEDPIYINEVLINHIQSDANVEIEQIPSEMLDDGLIDRNELIEICSKLIRAINTTLPVDLEDTFKKKLDNVIPIGNKAHYEKLPLGSSNSFIDFGGLFSIFEVQKQNIINDYGNLMELEGINIKLDDLENHSFQSISSVETDPSQQSILHALEAKRNLLIQGPPGTGKSQTLTAILINALENNKKTIVVCEKRTALEVLHDALIKKGLGSHCVLVQDSIKDRRIVVDSVRDRVDNSGYKRYRYDYSKESLDNLINKVNDLITNINNKHKKLDKKILGNKSWTDVVGKLLNEIKGNTDDSNLILRKESFNYSSEELNSILELIQKGQTLYYDFSKIESTSFIDSSKLTGNHPFVVEQRLIEDFDTYSTLLDTIKLLFYSTKDEFFTLRKTELKAQLSAVTERIGKILKRRIEFTALISSTKEEYLRFRNNEFEKQKIEFYAKVDVISNKQQELLELLIRSSEAYYKLRQSELEQQVKTLMDIIHSIENIIYNNRGNSDLKNETKISTIGYKILATFSKQKKQTISDYHDLVAHISDLQTSVQNSIDFPNLNFGKTLEAKLNELAFLKTTITKTQNDFDNRIKEEFKLFDFPNALYADDYRVALKEIEDKTQNHLGSDNLRKLLKSILIEYNTSIEGIHSDFLSLSEYLSNSQDIKLSYPFQKISINEKCIDLKTLKEDLTDVENNFNDKIEGEFSELNLDSALEIKDVDSLFHALLSNESSEGLREIINSIRANFKSYFSSLNILFRDLSHDLKNCKDIKLDCAFTNSFVKNDEFLSKIQERIALIETKFESKIIKEFQEINFLKVTESEMNLKSLPSLIKNVKDLVDKYEADAWCLKKIKSTEIPQIISEFESLIVQKNDYCNVDDDYFSIEFKWFQFYNNLSEINRTIINELKSKNNWKKTFMVYYLNSMLINSANLDLPTNDNEHKELDETLDKVEKEQLKYIEEYWYSKQIDATGSFQQRNVNLSVENLYNKRSSTQFKRISLRQIVQYDADLFTTFFPVILTTPEVASTLFKGMNGYFDIVMFDEASQLRLEDTLPAILKGKQIVIAGDEHQMPPSNYFSKIFDGTVENEEDLEEEEVIKVDKEDILLSCESLLDFGTELNFQKKHLDFHYRSRHPFLIDFSNYAFYNQRLKPIPNNFDYVPIKYIQVNGTFSDHTNEAEADMVLSIIDKNINRLPDGSYPSVGIATFNITQRNLIKSKILERQKFAKFDDFNAKIQELEENGMFIKNLENIQGDERDVLILSTTYGIGKNGNFAQRFGPINHSKGYKLLNVIITRAKFKIYCCTSIPEQVFMNYKEYLVTESSNNKKAVLYAYLAYCKAVSESSEDLRLAVLTTLAENTTKSASYDSFLGSDLESPFEEEVYQSLADRLGMEKLIPQLQFAGFRIDIVYDPKIEGVPKIAIECDGAKFHSSREAYLYDLHRQRILERHGFVFHRIWSTNWWRNPTRETTKLINFIKHIEATTISNYQDFSQTAHAFTDDVVIAEAYASQKSILNIERDNETIQAIENVAPTQLQTFADEVKLNSKVWVKYMNNGKDINIHIVQTENNKNAQSDGIQKIYHKSPLANSLLGQTVGDIVKIGNLDNFVEILKVTN